MRLTLLTQLTFYNEYWKEGKYKKVTCTFLALEDVEIEKKNKIRKF